jgi:uncharacterized membrane protein
MIRGKVSPSKLDDRLQYRGLEASRIDNLTDAVFGIAITLLIFNLENPDSFETLLRFTQTLPAFLLSISFIVLIWKEHFNFSRLYGFGDTWLIILNTLFIGLVIFYVYPLRFLTIFLTNFFFGSHVQLGLSAEQVPDLMIYYGLIVTGLYILLFLLHWRAYRIHEKLGFTEYEVWFTRQQLWRLAIMFSVPLISVLTSAVLKNHSLALAAILAGMAYNLYVPGMIIWARRFKKRDVEWGDG